MESVFSVLKAILVLPTKHKKDDETILEPVVNPSRSEVTLLLGNKFQESKSSLPLAVNSVTTGDNALNDLSK